MATIESRIMSIYSEAIAQGIEVAHHESDLYLPMTNEAADILSANPKWPHTLFRSAVDDKMWYDIPFAYDPWWQKRGMS